MFALLTAALLAAAPTGDDTKLVILELQAGAGVDPSVASAMTDAVSAEVTRRGYFQVISSRDVQTLLGLERQKQLLGCSDEANSCVTELAGAMGARFVLSGAVTKLGNAYQLAMQTLDSRKAQPLGRSTRIANDLETLRMLIPYSVAEATGTPQPPAPSRLPAFALIGGGSFLTVAGLIMGIQGFSQEEALRKELQVGTTQSGVLKPADFYKDEGERLGAQRAVSLSGVVAGAALIGLGVYLMPSTPGSEGIALVPTSNGFALAGAFW